MPHAVQFKYHKLSNKSAHNYISSSVRWPHNGSFPNTPPQMQKNLADISYTSQVIANNFVPNLVAMATRVGRGKMQLAAFDGPPKTPL